MFEIRLKGTANAMETQNLFGLSPLSVGLFLVSAINGDAKLENRKFTFEDYDIPFYMIIRKIEGIGNTDGKSLYSPKVYSLKRSVQITGEGKAKTKGGIKTYETILDRPMVNYDISVVVPDDSYLESVKSSLNRESFDFVRFMGHMPSQVKIREGVESLTDKIGGYLVYERPLKEKNVKAYIDEIQYPNEEKTRVLPAVLGYLFLEEAPEKTIRKGVEYDSWFAEPLFGLVNVKSIYQLVKEKGEEEVMKHSWYFKQNKNSIEIKTTKKN